MTKRIEEPASMLKFSDTVIFSLSIHRFNWVQKVGIADMLNWKMGGERESWWMDPLFVITDEYDQV